MTAIPNAAHRWSVYLNWVSRNLYGGTLAEQKKRVHFVGIGGIGMSALAKVLLEEGHAISGSDLKLSPLVESLAQQGATIFQGHSRHHLSNPDLVVVSSAVPEDNPEIQEAKQRGIPVIKRAEMLGRLMARRFGIAIAGTHGKTTTSSLIALILERAGLDPTILVGGEMVDLGTNAKLGHSPYLVAEADEFDGSFLKLTPKIAIITNVEPEHLDFYGSFEAVIEAFQQFMASVPADGHIIACGDDPQLRQMSAALGNAETYGFGTDLKWQATILSPNDRGGTDFAVEHNRKPFGEFSLGLPGRHNVSNALAAIAVSSILGIDTEKIRSTLASFKGVRRRFEIKGEVGGITIIEDYAHHPTEIKATLTAARERFKGRRILCLFQPHTFSRTKLLLGEFATAFDQADEVIITDIYAARERDTWGISAAALASALRHPNTRYVGDLRMVVSFLLKDLRSGDVLLIMGAGDVNKVSDEIIQALGRR